MVLRASLPRETAEANSLLSASLVSLGSLTNGPMMRPNAFLRFGSVDSLSSRPCEQSSLALFGNEGSAD